MNLSQSDPNLPPSLLEVPEYQVLKCIGRGSSAKVYSALSLKTGKKVALKVLSEENNSSSKSFEREVRALRALEHPNIVPLRDILFVNDAPVLCFDLVEGETLATLQSRLPYVLPELGTWLAIEILRALEHAHSRGIIHRDLKPSNVLISSSGKVFVTDFGLARLLDAGASTATGAIIGSPDYMSPEQTRGDVLTPRSDLFSLSSMLYFLVTGTAPFSKDSSLATLSAVGNAEFEPAHLRNPKVSWELSSIIDRGLSKNPDQRFESAETYRKVLEDYLRGLGLDQESFTLAIWNENPSAQTLRFLKAMSESLLAKSENFIQREDPEAAYRALVHLSLVAPTSQAVQELSSKISKLRQKLKKRIWVRRVGWGAAVALVAIGGIGAFVGMNLQREPARQSSPQIAPQVRPEVAQAGVATPEVKPEPIQPKPTQKPRLEKVEFVLPESMRAYWDGKEVGSHAHFSAPIGIHKLKLVTADQKEFEQKIKVIRGEPTVIRVQSDDGANP
jgi:serine/threonine-protein kinase